MALGFLRPFRHRSDGTISVQLGDKERELLATLVGELRQLVADEGDGATAAGVERLHPVVHPDDAEAQDEWERLVHDELSASRLAAIDVVEQTLDQERITPDQLTAWMQSVNALRLVLGTRLGVAEDHEPIEQDDPELPSWIAYDWLTQLVDGAVRALRPSLDDPA